MRIDNDYSFPEQGRPAGVPFDEVWFDGQTRVLEQAEDFPGFTPDQMRSAIYYQARKRGVTVNTHVPDDKTIVVVKTGIVE